MTNWLSYISWKRSQPCAHLLFLGLNDINAIEKNFNATVCKITEQVS